MFAKLTAALVLLAPVHAFWILTHDHALSYQRLDPIINPGAVSGHVHSIIGSDAFKPTMDYDEMQTATCTTSPVQDDKSSYWAQSLYHRAGNGSFTLIPISFVQTYYLQRDGPTQKKINAFPEGLRMVAGNPYRTSYNASNVEDKAINFVCLDYNDPTNDAGPQTAFPQRPCPDGMRMQVNFPSCWDGKNLDSVDHKSHMSYPVGGAPDSGDCPDTHPVKTILLFNEYVYDVSKFDYVSGQDNWVTAVGDPTGYSFHADFINGWKPATLEAAVDQCTGQLFGNLEQCPPFLASLDKTKASQCSLPAVVEENVMGPMAKLPGCNPFTGQPAGAPAHCANLPVPAIIGGPGASVLPGAPTSASSSAASTSAAHSVTSSAGAGSSAPASSSTSVVATESSAPSSVATSVASSATSVASSATGVASSVTATSSAASKTGGHHHHHYSATGAVAIATGTPKGKKGGKTCTRKTTATGEVLKPTAVLKPTPEVQPTSAAKSRRAHRAHHAGLKNRMNH